MILLDTNVISELMRLDADKKVIAAINSFPIDTLYISAITYAEILQGIGLLDEGKRKQNLLKIAQKILALFDKKTLPFNKKSAHFYADIIQQRTQQGRPIDFPDAQIAAIALQHQLQLYTRNIKDFEKISELIVINPWV